MSNEQKPDSISQEVWDKYPCPTCRYHCNFNPCCPYLRQVTWLSEHGCEDYKKKCCDNYRRTKSFLDIPRFCINCGTIIDDYYDIDHIERVGFNYGGPIKSFKVSG